MQTKTFHTHRELVKVVAQTGNVAKVSGKGKEITVEQFVKHHKRRLPLLLSDESSDALLVSTNRLALVEIGESHVKGQIGKSGKLSERVDCPVPDQDALQVQLRVAGRDLSSQFERHRRRVLAPIRLARLAREIFS